MNKLLIAVLALASIGTAGAQVKIAVINTQKALLDTEDIKKAQLDLEAKFKPRQDQMIKLQKELEDIQTQLQSGKLNELGTQEMQTEGQRKQRELQRMQQDLQDDVQNARTEILQRAGTRMQDVVKKLADEKGLDIVVDSANTVFYKTTFEITTEATAAYNKTYPVTATK
ncbi:MAG TPA: OmpH family outer membrane protein [Bryobacteraceae bacterium]|jgi:outer membrane protein|nr:OmpH family outer membrane protein [Bryobacteraceae bacterium]